MFKLPEPKSCKECGGAVVFHRMKYADVVVNGIIDRILPKETMMTKFGHKIHAFENFVTPHFFNFCLRTGLAKKQTEIDGGVELLAEMLWREALVRGITVWEFRLFGLPRNLFVAELPSGKQVFYEGIPLPYHGMYQAPWLDNKALLKENFKKAGLPIAKGGGVTTKKQALELFSDLESPVIVKPHSGSGSKHTFLHLTNEDELLKAFLSAALLSPKVIIEEELVGAVYRATVVDGKLAATLRRDPPSVVGDGEHTIAELVEIANEHPARSGPFFSKIVINEDAIRELAWNGHVIMDVLQKGVRVNFHQKVNWGHGGTTADVTDEVHEDNRKLFERVAEELKAPIVGIDFIIEDISRSWKEQKKCGIIECNSMPFFDNHHLPFEGKPRNVASAIWDMIQKYER